MHKIIPAFLIFYFCNILIGGIIEGGGGVHATTLTADITDAGLVVNVVNTDGFLRSDYVYINDEAMRYVSKTDTTLTVATGGRGYKDTLADAHSAGAKVYTPSASIINSMVGFNVAATDTTVGGINLPVLFWNFAWKSAPKLLLWDFPQYKISEWTQYLRIIFVILSAGLTFALVITSLSSWGGVAQSIFRRP